MKPEGEKGDEWINLDSPEEEEEEIGPESPVVPIIPTSVDVDREKQLAYISGKHEII